MKIKPLLPLAYRVRIKVPSPYTGKGKCKEIVKLWQSFDLAIIYADAMLDKGIYYSATIDHLKNGKIVEQWERC